MNENKNEGGQRGNSGGTRQMRATRDNNVILKKYFGDEIRYEI